MMKFSLAAALLGVVTAAASSTPGGTTTTIKLGNRQLRRGDPATEALFKKARPYKQPSSKSSSSTSSSNANNNSNTSSRKLDADNGDIDGSYSLKFSQCVDLKLYDEDLFSEEVIKYSKKGQIVSTKSYVLFHVCQGNNCYYESEEDLYIVDLASYVKNVAMYHAGVRSGYCEACLEYADYCTADDGSYADDAAAAEEEALDDYAAGDDGAAAAEEEAAEEEEQAEEAANDDGGGRRKLQNKQQTTQSNQNNQHTQNKQRRTKSTIDCNQCSTYNCYSNADDTAQQDLDDKVADWITSLAECQKTGQYWNGQDLYVSTMCTPYGDGAEIAVFVDSDCTAYTNLYSFADVYDSYYYNNNGSSEDLSSYAESYIKSAFTEVMPCAEQEFADPNDGGGDGDDEYEEEEEYEVNGYCQQIFEDGALDFGNCYANYENNNYGEDNEYSWYTYDMTYDDSADMDTVCSTVKTLDGEYSHYYDSKRSGSWYDRMRDGSISSASSDRFLETLQIVLYVTLAVLVIAAALYITFRRKRVSRRQPLYQGGAMI